MEILSDINLRPIGALLMFIEDGLPQTSPDGRIIAGKNSGNKTTEHMMLQAARLVTMAIKKKPNLACQSGAKMRIVQLCMYPTMPRSVIQCLSSIKS